MTMTKYFKHTNGPLLAAYYFQNAPYEKLRLYGDLNNVLFAVDGITINQVGSEAREIMHYHVHVL